MEKSGNKSRGRLWRSQSSGGPDLYNLRARRSTMQQLSIGYFEGFTGILWGGGRLEVRRQLLAGRS